MTDAKDTIENHLETSERPMIDVTYYGSARCVNGLKDSDTGSFFRADPGFRPTPKVPSGRKIVSFIDSDGLIRYKYDD
jgi:hypothetical protein